MNCVVRRWKILTWLYLLAIYVGCFIFNIGEVHCLDLTLVNEHSLVRNDIASYLKCVTDDAQLTHNSFKRVQDTGSGRRMPASSLTGPISPEEWPGKRLSMLADSGLDRAGVFSCEAKDESNIMTKAIAVKMGAGGGIWPEHYTYIANLNDDVILKFNAFDELTKVVWRFQGRIIPGVSSLLHNINNAASVHAGVYECYKQDDQNVDSRPPNKAMLRLIVRSCSQGKWNPPGCNEDCSCINGGACDDMDGRCICPPGFKGQHCEQGCGGNRFGGSCQFHCKAGGLNHGGDAEECKGRHFCLPDPYGCTCATGFSGIECTDGCTSGNFGADCKQKCHCKRPDLCNRFTGACIMGCASSWKGPSCQTTCDDGTWGDNCDNECHCNNNLNCDKVSGRCPNGRCASPYTGSTCQVDPINECSSNPCINDGVCVDDINKYDCECINGTGGQNCEVDYDDCEYKPCYNGGTCKDAGPLKYDCTCAGGFTGKTCQIDIDDCDVNKCMNNANCVDDVESYACECQEGFFGKYCERQCSPGTFYDEQLQECDVCAYNSYQDEAGKKFCVLCKPGFETKKVGAKKASDCIEVITKSSQDILIGVAALTGIAILCAAMASAWYYWSHKNRTRLTHLGANRSAW